MNWGALQIAGNYRNYKEKAPSYVRSFHYNVLKKNSEKLTSNELEFIRKLGVKGGKVWLTSKNRRTLAKIHKRYKSKKPPRLQLTQLRLKVKPTPGHKWLQERLKDARNAPGEFYVIIGKYIADYVDQQHSIIFHVDTGTSLSTRVASEVKVMDFTKKGYKVFRIKAFDEASYTSAIQDMLIYKNEVATGTLSLDPVPTRIET